MQGFTLFNNATHFRMFATHKYKFHLLAIFTIIIWGTTFVSTKVLIQQGLSPIEIMVYRFLIAYVGIWFISPKKFFANSLKDELLCVAAGMTGGSIYFLTENTALEITLASNVSLIVCTSPIFTAFLISLFYKEKIKPHLIIGSVIALLGVAFVVFNGSFILKLSPLGDFLTVLAALSWAFYGVILRTLGKKYPTLFLTRKVFIYGVLTILPFALFRENSFNPELLSDPLVLTNILFLGVLASLVCFISWNVAVKNLGVVQTTNYIYVIPLVTLITSVIVIDEKITAIALIGCFLILFGVYVSERGFPFK